MRRWTSTVSSNSLITSRSECCGGTRVERGAGIGQHRVRALIEVSAERCRASHGQRFLRRSFRERRARPRDHHCGLRGVSRDIYDIVQARVAIGHWPLVEYNRQWIGSPLRVVAIATATATTNSGQTGTDLATTLAEKDVLLLSSLMFRNDKSNRSLSDNNLFSRRYV